MFHACVLVFSTVNRAKHKISVLIEICITSISILHVELAVLDFCMLSNILILMSHLKRNM